jgi:hypothetical protein
MEQLKKAEMIDHFQERVEKDPINKLSRQGLYYNTPTGDSQSQPWLLNTEIITMHPMAEAGMPHTRPPNVICYPGEISTSDTTLIHELCHVHQRKFPTMWSTIFSALGWSVWNQDLPSKLDKYRRYNPDTIDKPLWIHGKWVPIPVFQDGSKPVLSDVDIWFYHIDGYHVKTVPEDILIEGLPSSAYEHPREITAYIISNPNKYRGTTAYNIIRRYIDI